MARNGRWRTAAAVGAAVLLLAACGSQVPPKDVVGAQGGAVNGVAAGNAVAGGGTAAGATGAAGGAGAAAGGGTSGGGAGTTSGGGGGTSGGGTSGGGGGTGGGAGARGGSGGGGGSVPVGSHVKAASCAGFKNGPGITNSTITIANSADISGPVEGLFKSVLAATTAYVNYFNSTSSICGRKLKVVSYDSSTSESGDQQAAQSACNNAFALVGSMGAFDAGGADVVTKCGIPDIRSTATETTRQRAPVTFGAYSLNTSLIPTSPFSYFKSLGDAYKHAAFVYLDAGASSLNASSFIKAEEKMGYKFVYTQPISVKGGLIPYDSYAHNMASKGVKYVQYIGAANPYAGQMKAAIDNESKNNSSFKPIWVMDPTGYSTEYTSAGSQTNGTYVFDAGPMLEEANKNPQLALYLNWLQRTSGGAPTFYGVYAWSAAALFVETALQLGGKLSRSTMIAKLRGVHGWTNHGMTPPNDVAGKRTPNCLTVMQYQSGHWVRKTPYPYTCGSLVNSGVS